MAHARVPALAAEPLAILTRSFTNPRILGAAWFVLLRAPVRRARRARPLRLDELGFSAVAIGATWLTAAALESVAAPLLGRLSDRRGRLLPLRFGLVMSAGVAAVIPWLGNAWPLALAVVAAAVAFGSFWAPGMSLLADRAEALGLEHAYAFALVSMAWRREPRGARRSGRRWRTRPRTGCPYLLLAGACVLTLVAIRPSAQPTENALEPSSLP